MPNSSDQVMDPVLGRWGCLALLFGVRTAMAFQFESVAAVAPMIRSEFGVGVADIGFLIGLYLAPGIVLALPGGAIGKRFGDKTTVLVGLALMTCGGLIITLTGVWHLQIVGRLMAGIGGVLLSVVMAKMVTDLFVGKEIATAMGILINSWPFGIALALLVLPPIAVHGGVPLAFLASTAFVFVGCILLAVFYRQPKIQAAAHGGDDWPSGDALWAVIVAGAIYGLVVGSFGMIFGFGPLLLAERGWTVASASSVTSIVLWLAFVSTPLGGLVADRSGRHDAVMVVGFVAFAIMLTAAARTDAVVAAFVVLGLVSGFPVGVIMSLPARVLSPSTRAGGMGIFFAVFYCFIVAAPWVGGWLTGWAGSARVTFDLGAAMLIAGCAALWLFEILARKARRQRSHFVKSSLQVIVQAGPDAVIPGGCQP
jgi:MFS family permease